MTATTTTPDDAGPETWSTRKVELLELAYAYVLKNGLGDLSLRPLATAVGSSPRVLLFCFGSKEGLVRALLARARDDELALVRRLDDLDAGTTLEQVVEQVWSWLADPGHRALLCLWVEAYGRSLIDPEGPWADFATASVRDWLDVFATHQPAKVRRTRAGAAERTRALALLRGGLLDLLATGDTSRVGAAVAPKV